MYEYDIVKDSTELRKLIVENPELPIVVLASYEECTDEYYWTYCSEVRCEIGEVLDCECPWAEGRVYNDHIEFEEALADYLSDTVDGADKMTDSEFEHLLNGQKELYSPHWHKAIIVMAGN